MLVPAEEIPNVMVGLYSLGLSTAFVAAEPKSRTTRALALTFLCNGWEFAEAEAVFRQGNPWFKYWDLLLLATAGVALITWIMRVAETSEASSRALSFIRRCRLATGVIAVAMLTVGATHLDEAGRFLGFNGAPIDNVGAAGLAACFVAGAVVVSAAGLVLATQRVDPAERTRATAYVVALPFLLSGIFVPRTYGIAGNLTGQLIFLVGAVRYHVRQGQRAQFLRQFLSPDVEKVVRQRGLAHAMRPVTLDITVVCCDLRGFTAFTEASDAEATLAMLTDYYDAVGSAVARVGATIEGYAGDGVLMLVGAPLPLEDHAAQGVALAEAVVQAASAVCRRWLALDRPLGVGVGVASGPVTVGGLGSATRLEYSAIGPAVNLAARLCSVAAAGEVLLAESTVQAAATGTPVRREPVQLKGLGSVVHYALAAPSPAGPGRWPVESASPAVG